MTALVKYNIGTYEGTVPVTCQPDDETEDIIARAKNYLRKKVGSFPLGMFCESWRVILRTDGDE